MALFITSHEAAERAGPLSIGRIHQILTQRRIKAKKFGRAWMVNSKDLERFLELDRPAHRPKKEGREV